MKKNIYQVYDDYTETLKIISRPGVAHEALILKHRETGQEIFVVHGHQGDLISRSTLACIIILTIRYSGALCICLG